MPHGSDKVPAKFGGPEGLRDRDVAIDLVEDLEKRGRGVNTWVAMAGTDADRADLLSELTKSLTADLEPDESIKVVFQASVFPERVRRAARLPSERNETHGGRCPRSSLFANQERNRGGDRPSSVLRCLAVVPEAVGRQPHDRVDGSHGRYRGGLVQGPAWQRHAVATHRLKQVERDSPAAAGPREARPPVDLAPVEGGGGGARRRPSQAKVRGCDWVRVAVHAHGRPAPALDLPA